MTIQYDAAGVPAPQTRRLCSSFTRLNQPCQGVALRFIADVALCAKHSSTEDLHANRAATIAYQEHQDALEGNAPAEYEGAYVLVTAAEVRVSYPFNRAAIQTMRSVPGGYFDRTSSPSAQVYPLAMLPKVLAKLRSLGEVTIDSEAAWEDLVVLAAYLNDWPEFAK